MILLNLPNREAFRAWLGENAEKEKECWVNAKRVRPGLAPFVYLDAVEEALCFGWIDSVWKNIGGVFYQRFSPRKKNSPWTELNKERARRLIRLGKMTKLGEKCLPPLGPRSYRFDPIVIEALKKRKFIRNSKPFHRFIKESASITFPFTAIRTKRLMKRPYPISSKRRRRARCLANGTIMAG